MLSWPGARSRPVRSYLTCGTPRTGSTLLCGLLAATGVAGKPESYFRLPDEPSYGERWGVQPAQTAGDQVGTDLEVLQHELGETHFVHLHRGDVLAQAVSWAKAEQTGYWQDGGGVVPGRSPRLDVNDIDRYVETINEHNLAWREWFDTNAIVPVVFSYEDLVADMASTVGPPSLATSRRGAIRARRNQFANNWPEAQKQATEEVADAWDLYGASASRRRISCPASRLWV